MVYEYTMWALLVCLLAGVASSLAAVTSDEVVDLPGLPSAISFKHYSGYLNASATHRLHYWFVESQNNPASDPVVLWLNGGPGCSSLDGLLSEHGPFLINDDGKTLRMNDFAWNTVANVLYLEAPVGVGYSYSTDGIYEMNDDSTAADSLAALKYFFKMFPEFAANEFFITGESYGGIYVPSLSVLVARDGTLNFRGWGIGNGMSDFNLNTDSLMFFGNYHGLWGEQLWDQLTAHCCSGGQLNKCNFHNNTDADCQGAVGAASNIIYGLNIYNLYDECYTGEMNRHQESKNHPIWQLFKHNPHVSQQHKQLLQKPAVQVTVVPPCVNVDGMTQYLNRVEVRAALHIQAGLHDWTICSDILHYTRQYEDMKPFYMELLSSGKYRGLVYNGDVDMACNFLMDEWFVDSLKQKVVEPYKAWHYEAADGSTQVAGFTKQFKNINFVTIKGAGHMVPQNKPRPSLEMFINFIHNKRFS